MPFVVPRGATNTTTTPGGRTSFRPPWVKDDGAASSLKSTSVPWAKKTNAEKENGETPVGANSLKKPLTNNTPKSQQQTNDKVAEKVNNDVKKGNGEVAKKTSEPVKKGLEPTKKTPVEATKKTVEPTKKSIEPTKPIVETGKKSTEAIKKGPPEPVRKTNVTNAVSAKTAPTNTIKTPTTTRTTTTAAQKKREPTPSSSSSLEEEEEDDDEYTEEEEEETEDETEEETEEGSEEDDEEEEDDESDGDEKEQAVVTKQPNRKSTQQVTPPPPLKPTPTKKPEDESELTQRFTLEKPKLRPVVVKRDKSMKKVIEDDDEAEEGETEEERERRLRFKLEKPKLRHIKREEKPIPSKSSENVLKIRPVLKKVPKVDEVIKEVIKEEPKPEFKTKTLRKTPSMKRDPSKTKVPAPPPLPSLVPKAPPPPPPLQGPGGEKREISEAHKAALEKLKTRPRRRPDWSEMMKEVEEGKKLRHVECNDRSQPILTCKSMTKVDDKFIYETEKDNSHNKLLKQIQGGVRLRPTQTNDRSRPMLDGLRKFRRQMTIEEQLQKSQSKINMLNEAAAAAGTTGAGANAIVAALSIDDPSGDELDDIDKIRDDLQSTKQMLALELRQREAQDRENKKLLAQVARLEAELEREKSREKNLEYGSNVIVATMETTPASEQAFVRSLKKEAEDARNTCKDLERKYHETGELLDQAKIEIEEQKRQIQLLERKLAQALGISTPITNGHHNFSFPASQKDFHANNNNNNQSDAISDSESNDSDDDDDDDDDEDEEDDNSENSDKSESPNNSKDSETAKNSNTSMDSYKSMNSNQNNNADNCKGSSRSKSTDTSKCSKGPKNADNSKNSEKSKDFDTREVTDGSEDSDNSDNSDNSEDSDSSEDSEDSDNSEGSDSCEDSDCSKDSKKSKDSKSSDSKSNTSKATVELLEVSERNFANHKGGGSLNSSRRPSDVLTGRDSSPDFDLQQSESDPDEPEEKKRERKERKLAKEVKILKSKLTKLKVKQEAAKKEKDALKQAMKKNHILLKEENKKFKKLEKEVHKMAASMREEEDAEDGDHEEKEKDEDEEEEAEEEASEEESEEESEESESEASEPDTASESEAEDAPNSAKKSNLEPRVKKHEGRLSAMKKCNVLLQANVDNLQDEITQVRSKAASLQSELDAVLQDLGF